MSEQTKGRTRIAITLASATIPQTKTKTKRKSAARWNVETRQMDYPPTKKQVMFLWNLCNQLGVEYERPATKRDAEFEIDRLVRKRKAKRRRKQRRSQRSRQQVIAGWRFGVGQTRGEELGEIRAAQAAGLTDEYVLRRSQRATERSTA